MMASYSTNEKSTLKMRIGNLEPNEKVRIVFSMIGELKTEMEKAWTLRIPSHISPRYMNDIDLINVLFKIFLEDPKNTSTTYMDAEIEWDFNITLISSEKVAKWKSDNHDLKEEKVSDYEFRFKLDEGKLPEKDLVFTFENEKQDIFCTLGKQCAAVTFTTDKAVKSNYNKYKGDYIFVLDRSGSMYGNRI